MQFILCCYFNCFGVWGGLGRTGASQLKAKKQGVDFLLGLCIRRNAAGYALLDFTDLLPLQFGIIDVRKA
eukprot:4748453-Amphidinium_carterae.1